MNRAIWKDGGNFDRGVVEYSLVLDTGASGAVATTSGGKGIKSITRNAAGKYTIVTQDTWFKFGWISETVVTANGLGTTNKGMYLNLVGKPTLNTVVIQFVDQTGTTANDLPDNSSVFIEFAVMKAST